MTEFVLDMGSSAGRDAFRGLDSFTQGYVEAMFFTSTGTGDDGDLQDASVSELAPSALELIVADCAKFQEVNAARLALAYERCSKDWVAYDQEAAGRDFWYTRNGHGVGFWDRDALRADGLGDQLSEDCRTWRECYLYRGDDGLLYVG